MRGCCRRRNTERRSSLRERWGNGAGELGTPPPKEDSFGGAQDHIPFLHMLAQSAMSWNLQRQDDG